MRKSNSLVILNGHVVLNAVVAWTPKNKRNLSWAWRVISSQLLPSKIDMYTGGTYIILQITRLCLFNRRKSLKADYICLNL